MAAENWTFDTVHSSVNFWVGLALSDKIELHFELQGTKAKAEGQS